MLDEPKTKLQMLKSGNGGSECSSPEVSPKRIKMESGSGSITRVSHPGSKNLPPQPSLICTGTQEFAVIKNQPGFVDHTLFIRNFLSKEQNLAIFAPRRFGKSSHLDMLKSFLSCVKAHKPYAKINRPPEERENYELFKGTKIVSCNDILEKHLGKHPVIHLDLKSAGSILGVEDAKKHFQRVVHNAYQEHDYLITSQKLCPNNPKANANAQQNCEEWCDDREYKKQDVDDNCLRNLARYLYNHFDGAKVYVLIDEFDAINERALRWLEGEVEQKIKQIEDIANVVTSSLCALTKGARKYVGGALITGVSYIMGIGYSPDLNNFKKIRFLEEDSIVSTDEDFVPFYGATEVEMKSLVEKLVHDDQLVKFKEKEEFLNGEGKLDADKIMLDVESRYNGYLDKNGRRIFCLWSVLQYLETGKPKHFWNQTGGSDQLCKIFRSATIAKDVLNLMQGKTITFQRLNKIFIRDLLELQELFESKRIEADCTLVVNFLMDLGYVSYTGRENKLKMPNSEIQAAYSEMLYYVIRWELHDRMSCRRVINKLSSKHEDKKTLQKQMLAIHQKLNNDLKKLKLHSNNPYRVNEAMAMIMCVLYGIMDQSRSFKFAGDLQLTVDGKPLSSDRPDYLLLHKSSNFCILWELKLNKNNESKYKTSKYALQEARGKEPTTENKFKDYMKTIEGLQLDALVIGLSVDDNLNVSLSYALNNDSEIFCITEKEKELHPAYYSDCIMLSNEEIDSDDFSYDDSDAE